MNTLEEKYNISSEQWTWTEATSEEFEKNRFSNNYYRIFHKDSDGRCIIDYKFWAKDDNSAIEVLNAFKEDHDSEIEYYYSTSGYYYSHDGKRYYTMEDMHEAWKNTPYDSEDREYDTEKIEEFRKSSLSDERVSVLNECRKLLLSKIEKIDSYEKSATSMNERIDNSDLKTSTEEVMDELSLSSRKLDDEYYDIRDLEYLVRTKHNRSESWNLNDHILEDLRYNVKRMISDGSGFPTSFMKNASDELGLEITENYEGKTEEESNRLREKACELWNAELLRFIDSINGYIYFSGYGIVDESDSELIEYSQKHSSEIPYKKGTDSEIDYIKLNEITQSHWKTIWDWMKEYGQNLWT